MRWSSHHRWADLDGSYPKRRLRKKTYQSRQRRKRSETRHQQANPGHFDRHHWRRAIAAYSFELWSGLHLQLHKVIEPRKRWIYLRAEPAWIQGRSDVLQPEAMEDRCSTRSDLRHRQIVQNSIVQRRQAKDFGKSQRRHTRLQNPRKSSISD